MAVFVDGDNLSVDHAPAIREAADRLGLSVIRRVFGRSSSLANWDAAPDFIGIRVGDAKNGADILLSMTAVEYAMDRRMDAAVIASNDRDFSHLGSWLRERRLHVLGLGAPKPQGAVDWRVCCVESADLPPLSRPAPIVAQPPRPVRPSSIHDQVGDVVRRLGVGGTMPIGTLGALMNREHKRTLASVGAPSWRAFLQASPEFYDLDPKGPNALVRLRA